jgi:Family of unknown function (DUF6338)
MTITSDDILATLRALIPGFIAVSSFYWFGLKVKRPDWRWFVWSVLAAAPLSWAGASTAELLGAKSGDLASAITSCGVSAVQGAQQLSDFQNALTTCVSDALSAHNPALGLAIGVGYAVLIAIVVTVGWQMLSERYPRLRYHAETSAWGTVLRDVRWLQVKTSDGVYRGWNELTADPTETADLDIYLRDPAVVEADGPRPLDAVEGMLIRRTDIGWVQVLKTPGDELGDPWADGGLEQPRG